MADKFEPLTLDDELGCLGPEEFEALSQYHERERWVWDQMCDAAADTEQGTPDEWTDIVVRHRNMCRNFKELAAEQERLDADHRTTPNKEEP
jgi:hypothetical protein